MKYIKLTTYKKSLPVYADSLLQKQQQIEVWNSGIEMLSSLFDLVVKVIDKVKNQTN